ncbi:MAG: universal stress protein [Deltaproteobacteria bacterium]|nr:universal stress protein [Deltaproteobacteria bacterium]
MKNYKRIMVLSRSTKECRKAIQQGIDLAKANDAKLYVVYSVHNPFGLEGMNIPLPSVNNLENEFLQIQKEATEDLQRLIEEEASAGLSVEIVVSEEEITKAALELVKEKNIDLLIVREIEEGRLEHFLFGRSTETLVRKMPCSILLIADKL